MSDCRRQLLAFSQWSDFPPEPVFDFHFTTTTCRFYFSVYLQDSFGQSLDGRVLDSMPTVTASNEK
jgi:hypothetical protein